MSNAKELDEIIEHLEKEEDITLENIHTKDSEGLGDTLEKVFAKFGVTEETIEGFSRIGGCGCAKRKKFLNKIFPYKRHSKKEQQKRREEYDRMMEEKKKGSEDP